MDRRTLGQKIYAASYLSGTFTLRSGQVSHQYFDKYLFESDPALLSEIAAHMAELLPAGTEILAGLEMGGIPVATALSLNTGLPVVFMRKKAKEYGTCKLAEGIDVRGKNVCVVEDVVTTGGQIVLSASDLRALGARVEHVVCVIQREKKSADIPKEKGLSLAHLFTIEELEDLSSK